MYDLQLNFIKT